MFRNIDLRSKRRAKGWRKPVAPPTTVHEGAIVEHVARHLARPAFVLHELVSETVHLDVHVVPPAPAREFWFLFTTGMSARPMRRPPDAPGRTLAELSILLPPDWRVDEASLQHPRWFWPLREMKTAALLPHRCQVAFGEGQTISSSIVNGPTRFFAPDTRLSSLLVTRSTELPRALDTIRSGAHQIDLFTLLPLYCEELAYKLAHGHEALLASLRAAGISDIVDPARRSAVPESGRTC